MTSTQIFWGVMTVLAAMIVTHDTTQTVRAYRAGLPYRRNLLEVVFWALVFSVNLHHAWPF